MHARTHTHTHHIHLFECSPSACSFFRRVLFPDSMGSFRSFIISNTSDFTCSSSTLVGKRRVEGERRVEGWGVGGRRGEVWEGGRGGGGGVGGRKEDWRGD